MIWTLEHGGLEGVGNQSITKAESCFNKIQEPSNRRAISQRCGHSDLSQDAWLRWFDTSARVTT